jgi:hypothetical protein
MKTLLAICRLTIIVAALCGSVFMPLAQAGTGAATLANGEATRYEVEATLFERTANRYAMTAKRYRAAGKPITTAEARRCAALSDLYRQRATRDRDLAKRTRQLSAVSDPRNP